MRKKRVLALKQIYRDNVKGLQKPLYLPDTSWFNAWKYGLRQLKKEWYK